MERYTHAPAAPSEMAGQDLNAILGGKPVGGSTFDLPSKDSAFHGNTPAPAFAPPMAGGFAPPPLPSFSPPPPPAFTPSATASGSVFGGPIAGGAPPPLKSVPSGAPPLKMPFTKSPSWAAPPAPAPVVPAALPSAALPSAALTSGEDGDTNENDEATRIVPFDESEEEAAHFAHVYDEFVQVKKQCGESMAGMSIDKFLVKLRDNKTALVAKHGCRTVRFSVYVKDGKAALKATPIRD